MSTILEKYHLSIIAPYYRLRDMFYNLPNQKKLGCFIISICYVAIMLWFAHIALIHDITLNQEENKRHIEFLLEHHGHFLMLVTNLGMLLLLFFDLLFTNRLYQPKTITFLNIIAVLAIITAYGCAAGHAVNNFAGDNNEIKLILNRLGIFDLPNIAIISLIIFAIVLCYLKYVALKPDEE